MKKTAIIYIIEHYVYYHCAEKHLIVTVKRRLYGYIKENCDCNRHE